MKLHMYPLMFGERAYEYCYEFVTHLRCKLCRRWLFSEQRAEHEKECHD